MKKTTLLALTFATLAAGSGLQAKPLTASISGDYLEVRSCEVFTGFCVANSEMGLSGKEGMLVWSIREGAWKGTPLNGLGIIAVICTDDTLGDLRYHPRAGKAVLIVDAKASAKQKKALIDFARSMAGSLVGDVADVKALPMALSIRTCTRAGCASVKAGNLVEISTRCLSSKDHLCGNEEAYYPPLTEVREAMPAYTELAAYRGGGLNVTWESTAKRSAFLATFMR